jgi:hypothetical protein
MALQSLWVHGNTATIELNRRGRGISENIIGIDVFLRGIEWTAQLGQCWDGARYRCQENSDYWFHLPVPTLAIVNGTRARLRRATVLFTADSGVFLSALHVWDGPNRVFARDGLSSGGERLSPVDHWNSFALPDAEVFFGIGISVQFHFVPRAHIIVVAAGIDFEA